MSLNLVPKENVSQDLGSKNPTFFDVCPGAYDISSNGSIVIIVWLIDIEAI